MPAFARSCTTSGWGWRFSRGRSPVLPDRDRDDIAGEVTKPLRSSINSGPPPDYRVSAEVSLDFELFRIDANVVFGARGTPDISMSASCDGVVVFYYSFRPTRIGWHLVCGTSEASPLFAGIVAMADQLAGDRKSTRLNSSHVEISYAV